LLISILVHCLSLRLPGLAVLKHHSRDRIK
jgi:hypothetical protein